MHPAGYKRNIQETLANITESENKINSINILYNIIGSGSEWR